MLMFRVIMRGRNVASLVGKTVKSLKEQTCPNWRCYIYLDAPTDNSVDVAMGISVRDDRFSVYASCHHFGVAAAMYSAPRAFQQFDDDDILAFVDGDGDTLPPKALRIVEKVYQKHPETMVTHGSYIKRSKGRRTKISHPYPSGANVRSHPWRASHLKTMKWNLFSMIPKDCFTHNGLWLPAASDVALMLPAMEMAGPKRCRHIHKITYNWRDRSTKAKRKIERRCEKIVRKKKPMAPVDWEAVE
ncbi:MAG: glycosyltransferase [Armatimonadia bacterium]|nr:glycosyltransferase [Armatimonadia bacterium]